MPSRLVSVAASPQVPRYKAVPHDMQHQFTPESRSSFPSSLQWLLPGAQAKEPIQFRVLYTALPHAVGSLWLLNTLRIRVACWVQEYNHGAWLTRSRAVLPVWCNDRSKVSKVTSCPFLHVDHHG